MRAWSRRLGLLRALRVASALLLAGAPAQRAQAHEPWTYGFGSRATAMGGAVSADASDFSASYYNPAGLAMEEGLRLGLGYFYADNVLRIDDRDSGVASSHGVTFGLAATGKVFGLPIGLGVATHIPDEGLSRITALRQDVPRWELYDNRSSVLYLAANLAIRPFEWLAVGGGLSFLASTRGRFRITGAGDLLYPYDSKLRHEVDVDLESVRYPQFGATVKLGEAASIAVVYRGQTSLDLQLTGTIDATLNAAGIEVPLLYELQARTVQAFLPQQVVVGVSLRPLPPLSINADVTFVDWGGYQNPTARTVASLAAEVPAGFPIELPNDVKNVTLEDPGFASRVVPRVGLEWRLPIRSADGATLVTVPVRGGYFFELSPVPDQRGATNFVDADRHTGSFGVGVDVPAVGLSFDVHGALSILPERLVEKTSPVDLVGDYRASGEMVNAGATLRGAFL
jgi:long-chain fatty acid transport protein